MKTLEYHHGNNWLDKLLNAWPFCIHTDSVKPVLEIEWGANPNGPATPMWNNLKVRTGKDCQTDSLFRNGVVYLRLLAPFGIFWSVRWAAFKRRSFLQSGIGWKLNGRAAALFRVQGDESAAKGVHGPNYGQAVGFAEGNK